MRTFKSIRDPAGYEAMVDKTRRRIIFMLRAKDMTVSQLAEALRKTPQAIYHQISILRDVGMVEIAREERVKHFIETYYRATAEIFLFQDGEVSKAQSEAIWSEALAALSKVGMRVRTDDEFVHKVAKANAAIANCGPATDLEEKLAKLDESILLTNTRALDLARLALMSDRQFDEFMASWQELRGLLNSGVTNRKSKQ
jgi:DNA-binding transcriptional ArsR family regulator